MTSRERERERQGMEAHGLPEFVAVKERLNALEDSRDKVVCCRWVACAVQARLRRQLVLQLDASLLKLGVLALQKGEVSLELGNL